MLTKPVAYLVPAMAVPTIIAMLITAIYNLADTYFVSSLGTAATAAVGVNAAIDQFISMAGSFLAFGANSYMARLLGKKEEEKAEKVFNTALFSALGLGIAVLVGGISLCRPLVTVLGATPDCLIYSMDYAKWILLAAPFMAGSLVLNQCLRSEGNAAYSMLGMGLGGILNIALDPLFIFIMHKGVAGAAQATAISKIVSFAILIMPYLCRKCSVNVRIRYVCFEKDIVYEIASVGASSLFRTGCALLSGVLLNNIAGHYSTMALAAISVTNRIMMFPFNIILGYGMGFQPVAGFNWGAGRYDRVWESFWFSIVSSGIGSAIMGILIGIFARPCIMLFNSAGDVQMMEIGTFCLRTQCVVLVFHAWVMILNMLFAGCGKAGKAMITSISRQGICFLPAVFLLPMLWGVKGLAAVQAVADILSMLIAIPLAYSLVKEIEELRRSENIASAEKR